MVKELTRLGFRCSVLTEVPSYPTGQVPQGFRNRLIFEDRREGARVFRAAIFPFKVDSIFDRVVAYTFFLISAAAFICLWGRKRFLCDAYILSTPPVTMNALAPIIGAVLRRPILNDVRDFWPEALQGTYIGRSGIRARTIQMLQLLGIRRSKSVVTVTPGLMDRVDRAMKSNRISRPLYYVPNGVDLGLFKASDVPMESAGERLTPPGSKTILYSGILSRSQKPENVIRAFKLVAEKRSDAMLLLIGRGDAEATVKEMIERTGLGDRVRLLDPVPRETLISYIRESAVCLVPLHENQVDALTTKFFEYLACEKPVIATSSNNLKEILSESGAGLFVSINDEASLASAITSLLSDEALGKRMGKQGRSYLEKSVFNRSESVKTLAGAISVMVGE
jgi:glycosyltransferase involved in cell wall biosynthesis